MFNRGDYDTRTARSEVKEEADRLPLAGHLPDHITEPAWKRRRDAHPLAQVWPEVEEEEANRPRAPEPFYINGPGYHYTLRPSPAEEPARSMRWHARLMRSPWFLLELLKERWTRRGVLRSRFRRTYQR